MLIATYFNNTKMLDGIQYLLEGDEINIFHIKIVT